MSTRVLCLGNTLLADDAFGFVVAERLRRSRPDLEVCESSSSGFDLLDCTLGATRLFVIDTMNSGKAAPGTVSSFREEEVPSVPGVSPHYIGLFEALRLGRALNLPVPSDVRIIVVEPADCLTVGGPMHPGVQAAVADVLAFLENDARATPDSKFEIRNSRLSD
jgi:hydrogenase maturation protease